MPDTIFREIIVRTICELIIYGIGYWTGFLFLSTITLGRLQMARLMTIHEKNRSKRKWYKIDWNIWIHQPMKGRELKAECVLFVGLAIWAIFGIVIFLLYKTSV